MTWKYYIIHVSTLCWISFKCNQYFVDHCIQVSIHWLVDWRCCQILMISRHSQYIFIRFRSLPDTGMVQERRWLKNSRKCIFSAILDLVEIVLRVVIFTSEYWRNKTDDFRWINDRISVLWCSFMSFILVESDWWKRNLVYHWRYNLEHDFNGGYFW